MDSNEEVNILYGDIDSVGMNLDYQRVVKENEELKNQLNHATMEISELKTQLMKMVMEKERIEKNLVSIYNTALKEISRKDRELRQLTTELDSLRVQKLK